MPTSPAFLARTLLSTAALLATATPVLAQPAATEPAPAPIAQPAPAAQPAAPVVVVQPVIVAPPAAPAPAPVAPPSAQPAAPVAPVAATTAPQNADWNDVSHINGQLVPVGQRNDYTYRFRKTNVSVNPLGFLFGVYGVSVSHALGDHIAIRGDVNIFDDLLDSDTHGFEVGAGAPIYLRRTYQGPFVEPGLIIRQTSADYSDESDTTFGPQMLIGWHWTWDSGLNVAMAFGGGRNLGGSDSIDYDGDGHAETDRNEPFVNGYLRFGYAF